MTPMMLDASTGQPLPLGLSETRQGFNFAVFSRHAHGVTLLVFEGLNEGPAATFPLDPARNRTGDVWHVALTGPVRGKTYAFRVKGPWDPGHGHRFNAEAPILDPYAIAPVGSKILPPGRKPQALQPRAWVVDDPFDWQDDCPPNRPWPETIIYETHIRGLTIHPTSGVVNRGTYAGLVEKIPYLAKLGITAVELMPVQEFLAYESNPASGKVLRNYWGYNPISLFAPATAYADTDDPAASLYGFKTMVRALHRAGIEVILDVVFNHTAEGDDQGPTFSFRGLDNVIYYLLQPGTGRYIDYTGCGNTLNCNHPVVRSLIIDCLRHWVAAFHVDGFRFDLASVLGRDIEGRLLANPPLLEEIAQDPLLRRVKLIAEAWDLGGAFQVGSFPGRRWADWNCCFRNDVRRFWRGDPGMTGAFATRLCGSADLFQRDGESPLNSINFVTCHDGFTLNDLVSYARKHNEANGEDNRDGLSENHSENNGTEGPSDDPPIEETRLRQIKNLLLTLFVSRGVPMLLGGDEFRRTQQGNNNAYCQDNEISWYDWRLAEKNASLVRFVSRLITFRKEHPVLSAERFYTETDITWLGVDGAPPDWHGRDNRIGCVIHEDHDGSGIALCLLFNAAFHACRFRLPPGQWRVAVDTAAPSPRDFPDTDGGAVTRSDVVLAARSSMVLVRSPNAGVDATSTSTESACSRQS